MNEDLHGGMRSLHYHAVQTRQELTEWRVGLFVEAELKRDAYMPTDPDQPKTYRGIPLVLDPNLPDRRVVLMAGQNTVGAFSIGDPEQMTNEVANG